MISFLEKNSVAPNKISSFVTGEKVINKATNSGGRWDGSINDYINYKDKGGEGIRQMNNIYYRHSTYTPSSILLSKNILGIFKYYMYNEE